MDKTGLVQQRDITDLMRYASMAQGIDSLSDYGGFIPFDPPFNRRPKPSETTRFSDEQLYALALYLETLTAPTNPSPPDEQLSVRGKTIFKRQGCGGCHPPPLYTNNKLIPAPGFQVPNKHAAQLAILRAPLGTDPTLTMSTRRGTGYYKVPSLRGVWARGPLEHNGSVATLEDWFDAVRLKDDYVPTGLRGYGLSRRAVKGHEFGLGLNPEDKSALIAFLRTL